VPGPLPVLIKTLPPGAVTAPWTITSPLALSAPGVSAPVTFPAALAVIAPLGVAVVTVSTGTPLVPVMDTAPSVIVPGAMTDILPALPEVLFVLTDPVPPSLKSILPALAPVPLNAASAILPPLVLSVPPSVILPPVALAPLALTVPLVTEVGGSAGLGNAVPVSLAPATSVILAPALLVETVTPGSMVIFDPESMAMLLDSVRFALMSMALVASKNVGSSVTSKVPRVMFPVSCPTCALSALSTFTVPVIVCASTLTVACAALMLNCWLWKFPPVTLIVPGLGEDKVMAFAAENVPPGALMVRLFDKGVRVKAPALDTMPELKMEFAVSVRLRPLVALGNNDNRLGVSTVLISPFLSIMLAALSVATGSPVVDKRISEPESTSLPAMFNVWLEDVRLRITSTPAGMVSDCNCLEPRKTTPPSAAPFAFRRTVCVPLWRISLSATASAGVINKPGVICKVPVPTLIEVGAMFCGALTVCAVEARFKLGGSATDAASATGLKPVKMHSPMDPAITRRTLGVILTSPGARTDF
jgi:hypothetical protein